MFKKPPQLKPASPLRSSSRRAFLAHLQALYPALADATPEVLSEVVPNGLRHCGATTSGGQKAVIYTDDHGKPLWFELGPQAGSALQQSEKKNKKGGSGGPSGGEKLFEVFPTVYALWLAPDILPRLPTWPQIVDPTLLSGSALMIPGLIPPPHTFPADLQHASSSSSSLPTKSTIVAITPYPSPVPLVVARLDADMKDIVQKRSVGEKGKAATTIHALGDFLWELGGKGEPPAAEQVAAAADSLQRGGEEQIQQGVSGIKLDDGDGQATNGDAKGHAEDDDEEENGQQEDTQAFTAKEVDLILNLAMLLTLTKLSKQSQQFPMPLSSFYSSHVLPNRPAHWPPLDAKGKRRARLPDSLVECEADDCGERIVIAESTDVRRSSAKKLTKWIKGIEKRDLVKCKDIKGKDTVIVSITSKHPDLEGVTAYLTLSQQALQDSENGQTGSAFAGAEGATAVGQASSPSSDANKKTQVVVERFWKANASSVKLFQEMGASTSEPLSRPVIRQYLNDFLTARSLIDPADQSQIKIDDAALTHALFPKVALMDIPPRMRREPILDKLLSASCIEYHRLSRLRPDRAREWTLSNTKASATSALPAEGLEKSEEVGPMTKGPHKRLHLEIKPRQGRKVVSLLTGLDQYGVEAESFAADLMRSVGASASAQVLQPATAKVRAKYEVFVQGDQRKVILDFLAREGIDKAFVEVVDLTKK